MQTLIYDKATKVIESCKTRGQLKVAYTYVLRTNKILDIEFYLALKRSWREKRFKIIKENYREELWD